MNIRTVVDEQFLVNRRAVIDERFLVNRRTPSMTSDSGDERECRISVADGSTGKKGRKSLFKRKVKKVCSL